MLSNSNRRLQTHVWSLSTFRWVVSMSSGRSPPPNTRSVTEPLLWPQGWHTWRREMTTPLPTCMCVGSSILCLLWWGSKQRREEVSFMWGTSVHPALQCTHTHSQTTCYTNTHTWLWLHRSVLGLRLQITHTHTLVVAMTLISTEVDQLRCVCKLLQAEMTFAVNHKVG